MPSDDLVDRHLGRVARGGAIGLAGALVSAAAGFALVVVVARGMAPDRAGAFFAATAVFLVLVALSGLGTDAGLARFLLRHEASGDADRVRRTVGAAGWPVLAASVASAAGLLLASDSLVRLLGLRPEAGAALRVLAIALPFAALAEFALAVTRALGQMRSTALFDKMLRSGIQVAAVVVALQVDGGILAVTAGWAVAYAVSMLVACVAARRLVGRRLAVLDASVATEPVQHGAFWSFTWPRGVARLAQIGIQKGDIILVAALLSPAHAAIYTAATRFVSLGQFATLAITQVLQPRFTAILIGGDHDTLQQVYRVATAWSMVLAWPLYVAVAAAPTAYLSIFGGAYTAGAGTVGVVVVMALAMLLATASGPVDTLLLMSGRSRASLGNAVAALAVDLVLLVLLVPWLGIVGAALAWACAVATRCCLAFFQVRADLRVTPGGRTFVLAALVPLTCLGVPATAYTLSGADGVTGLLGVLTLGTAAYVVALVAVRRHLQLDLLARALMRRPAPRPRSSAMTDPAPLRRLSSSLRRRLPAPAVAALRRLALGWGMATADLRMVPSFLIVGAQRSGTTTLFRLLEAHPHLVRPTLSKGTGYFDDDHHRGRRWYLAHFPLRLTARLRGRGQGVQTFECSGYYLFHPLAADRIARDLPGVKVVVMVRDPVERACSAHRHERARGFEDLDLDEALAREADRLAGEDERLRTESGYRSFAHRHHAYLGRSTYAPQVARFIDALGPDRVLVVDADDFFADPVDEFDRLQRWLGLPTWQPPSVEQWNAHQREPLPPEQRATLLQHFEDHDRELARLLGRELAWRRTEVTR